MPPQPAPAGGRNRGVAVWILAALSVVLLLLAGAMTALYISKNSALADAKRTIRQRDSTVSAKTAEVESTRRDLQAAKDDLAKTKTDLSGSQNQAAELQRQKDVISKCLNLLAEGVQAASNGDRATATKKQNEAQPVCDEADRYLG
jgi:flagellar basal body-associated protein FliL